MGYKDVGSRAVGSVRRSQKSPSLLVPVVPSLLLSQLAKQSRKGSFLFSSISLVKCALFVNVVIKSVNFVFVNGGKSVVNVA